MELDNMIKYYKAEVNGKTYVRQSKNDYKVAMVSSTEWGVHVCSFNSKETSKSSTIGFDYGSGFHTVTKRCVHNCKGNQDYCKKQKELYAAAKVWSIPVKVITKKEYLQIRGK